MKNIQAPRVFLWCPGLSDSPSWCPLGVDFHPGHYRPEPSCGGVRFISEAENFFFLLPS